MSRPLLLLSASLLLLAGCGGEDTSTTESGTDRPQAGGGGTLQYVVAELPAELDPLAATSPEAQLVARQLYEPLVARLNGPYGDASRQSGLVQGMRPSRDRSIWTLALRAGVRFHDGTPFNAAAVLANARRWRSLPEGRGLLPSLFAVDAPRPDVVRFVLTRPTPELPRQLSSARLGIVSPEALQPRSGTGARIEGGRPPGTGPFELRRRDDSGIGLDRNAEWWGSPLGLGPALDALEFGSVPAEAERLRLLQAGEADVAAGLSAASLTQVSADPLLTTAGGTLALSRSVRGIDSARAIPFSGVWLTTVEGG